MKKIAALIALVIVVSCAAPVVEKSPETAAPPPPPPVTTGAVKLVYEGALGKPGEIRAPWGISFGVDGTLYVCDRGKSSVVRLDSEGAIISRFDSFTNRTERLYAPVDVCSSGGIEVYTIDASDSRVLRFDRNLKNGFTIYRGGSDDNKLFGSFSGLAYDKISGDLYITDRETGAVIRMDMLGGSIRTLGAFGSERTSLRLPAGLDIDSNGVLYIADTGNHAVAVMKNFGARITYIGGAVLEAPVDAAVLPGGTVAVADLRGIVILSPAGAAEAIAGFGIDREMTPRSVAFSNGKLYVSDGTSASILVYRLEQ
ncbi:NHL repeat-containing protein [bacterium]|nr:NHL repeat-containing protein [bacterium]